MWSLEYTAVRGCFLLTCFLLGFTLALGTEAEICPEICNCFVEEERLHVDCSRRGLTELPTGISTDVQDLDLSNNLFDSYPDKLNSLGLLESLSFAGNQLSVPLPTYFRNFGRLTLLNLTHNKYDAWDDYGLGPSLEILDLSLNFINRLGVSSFRRMASLQYLDMSENRITYLPETIFSETLNLETLILSRNDLDHIPQFHSTSLKRLDLSMCQISSLHKDSFSEKTSLLEVNLSTNQIDSIPDLLSSRTIQSLDLSFNNIQFINSNTFRELPHLAVLDLSGNEFEEIWTPGYFSQNKYLREVHLTGNRWGCDGFGVNLLLMFDYLTRDARVPDASALICYSPSNVTGWSWQRAYVVTWHIGDTSDDSFKYASVLAGLAIGVIITAFLCRAKMKRKIRELETQRQRPHANGIVRQPAGEGSATPETRVTIETVDIRIPLRDEISDDLPPTYDEALLMPRLDGSFHSLPDYLGPRGPSAGDARLSRSINNLLDEGESPSEARRNRTSRSSRRATARISVELAQQ